MSFGAYMEADPKGRAVVRERLVVIEPGAVQPGPAPAAVAPKPPVPPRPAPVAARRMPVAAPIVLQLASPTPPATPRLRGEIQLGITNLPTLPMWRHGEMSIVKLPLSLSPLAFPKAFVSLTIQPFQPKPEMFPAMPKLPERDLPTAQVEPAPEYVPPPLPLVDASVARTSAVMPSPQSAHVAKSRSAWRFDSQPMADDSAPIPPSLPAGASPSKVCGTMIEFMEGRSAFAPVAPETAGNGLFPAPIPAGGDSATCQDDGRPTWNLTLDEATRTALANSPMDHDHASERIREVRFRFWDLHRARSILQAREATRDDWTRAAGRLSVLEMVQDATGGITTNSERPGDKGQALVMNLAIVRASLAEKALAEVLGLSETESRAIVPSVDSFQLSMLEQSAGAPYWSATPLTSRLTTTGSELLKARRILGEACAQADKLTACSAMEPATLAKTIDAIHAREAATVREADARVAFEMARFDASAAIVPVTPIEFGGVVASPYGAPYSTDLNFQRFADESAEIESRLDAKATPAAFQPPTAKTRSLGTLSLKLDSAPGATDYESSIKLGAIGAEPITVRIPMADGTVVEVAAPRRQTGLQIRHLTAEAAENAEEDGRRIIILGPFASAFSAASAVRSPDRNQPRSSIGLTARFGGPV